MKEIFKQQTTPQAVAMAIIYGLMFIFGSALSKAETVYFNDADRGPADTLQMNGVTVANSPVSDSFRLVTVFGLGLGIASGFAPIGEFDSQWHFPANPGGGPGPDAQIEPGVLQLTVDGVINSVTVVPHFRILSSSGTPLPDTLSFEILCAFMPTGHPQFPTIGPLSIGQPVTFCPNGSELDNPTSLQFQMTGSWGEMLHFSNYRMEHLSEEQTFQFGISVLSLNYTPIPEASAATLLALGLAGLLCSGVKTKVLHNRSTARNTS